MKGLLLYEIYKLRDKYLVRTLFYWILAIAVSCIIGGKSAGSGMVIIVAISFGMVFTLTSYLQDERSGWLRYSAVLPYLRAQVIGAKYITATAVSVLISIVSVAFFILSELVHGVTLNILLLAECFACAFAGELIILAVCMPLMVVLSATVAIVILSLIVGFVSMPMTVLLILSTVENSFISSETFAIICACALTVAVVLFALSFPLSVALFKRKEF